jgi:hypothetical protein
VTGRETGVRPVVSWPRRVEAGGSYLVTVDLVRADDSAPWPYDEEEFVVGCLLDGRPLCTVRALGDAGVVLHRFGGTYGPARFVAEVDQQRTDFSGAALWLTLTTAGGVPFYTGRLPVDGTLLHGVDVATADAGSPIAVEHRPPNYRFEPFPGPEPRLGNLTLPGLLSARRRVVPFLGRYDEISELRRWTDREEAMSVLLMHAPGGYGKTRLALEFASIALPVRYWTALQVTPGQPDNTGERTTARGDNMFVVVDHADRWLMSDLLRLAADLEQLARAEKVKVRVLMLARSAHQWPTLAHELDAILGSGVAHRALGPLVSDVSERVAAYRKAAESYASAIGMTRDDWPPPADLSSPEYESILAVHMAALDAVVSHQAGNRTAASPLISAHLLQREITSWQNHSHESDTAVLRRTAFCAALAGPLKYREAQDLLLRAGVTDDPQAATRIIADFRVFYPASQPDVALQPFEPSRLREDFIAMSIPGRPAGETLGAGLQDEWATTAPALMLGGTRDIRRPWHRVALAVLVETACRWPHVAANVLFPLLRDRPYLAADAADATIAQLTTLPDLGPDLLRAVTDALPVHEAETGTTPARPGTTADVAARMKARQAQEFADAGLYEPAMVAARAAADTARLLADEDPARRRDLAVALDRLAGRLAATGRDAEALSASEEAVEIFNQLVHAEGAEHLPNLAAALTNLANRFAATGRTRHALGVGREAVETLQQLTGSDAARHRPNAAAALTNLALDLAAAGLHAEALDRSQEAIDHYRHLAAENPIAYQAAYALSLGNHALRLARAGRNTEALSASAQAVDLFRELAVEHPAIHRPGLARALSNHGARLARTRDSGDALAVSTEAVHLYRDLVATHPAAHRPGLAASLHNHAQHLARAQRRGEAVAAALEAVELRRTLVAADRTAHLLDLAMSLWNVGYVGTFVGDFTDQAIAATAEGIDYLIELTPGGDSSVEDAQRAAQATHARLLQARDRADASAETLSSRDLPTRRL